MTAESAREAVLSGVIEDATGAVVRGASAELRPVHGGKHSGQKKTSDDMGHFQFRVSPGEYLMQVESPGFALFTSRPMRLTESKSAQLSIHLSVDKVEQEISVPEEEHSSPRKSGSALVLEGDQLNLLSNDDATFRQQLMALAGVNGRPNVLVNGLSGGGIPPKSSIRSVRINENPFSSSFSEFGGGRVEITTQPGGDRLHGAVRFSGTDQGFSARNPYATVKPDFYDFQNDGNLNGQLPGKLPFFLSDSIERLANNAVVNAADPLSPAVQISTTAPAPQLTQDYSIRLDREFSAQNHGFLREEWSDTKVSNDGIAPLILPDAVYASATLTNTLQIADTQALGTHSVNDFRAQYLRTRVSQRPNSHLPSVVVQGSFQSGGSPTQELQDNQDLYEVQDQFETERGAHAIHAGGRLRVLRDANRSSAGFNGQYIFPDVASYLAGRASQYSQTIGDQNAALLMEDLGVFAEDDWKVKPNLTLSFGLRFESQWAIPDHSNPGPRAAFAWDVQPGKRKSPLVTVRGGYGLFYDRFPAAQLLQSIRQNGTRQVAYLAQNTGFNPDGPPPDTDLSQGEPTIYQVNPRLRNTAGQIGDASVERALGQRGSISADLQYIHNAHGFLTRNLNAPLPGTVAPGEPGSGVRPFGAENLYSFSSDANGNLERFTLSGRLQPSSRVFLFAVFVAEKNYAESDGVQFFPSNEYNLRQDYGRAATNRAQWFTGGLQWRLPYGFRVAPYVDVHSGLPFNITTGQDLNGDTIYNDRPAFGDVSSSASVVHTAFGNFNVAPTAGQPVVPRNSATAPGYFWLQMHVSEDLRIGPRPEPSGAATARERPWILQFAVEANNVTNHNNPGLPVGVLSAQPCGTAGGGSCACSSASCALAPSAFFGRSLSLANDFSPVTASNRTILLQTSFTW